MGVDKMGVDKMGVDEMGTHLCRTQGPLQLKCLQAMYIKAH